MRRILSLLAVVALMVAFAMPVVTADAASHEKAQEAGKEMMKKSDSENMMKKGDSENMMKKGDSENMMKKGDSENMMKKGGEEGKKAMEEMKPENPCAPKKH